MLTHLLSHFTNFIQHKKSHLKVSLFVWCLLCNHIPTKVNLCRRDILRQEFQLCQWLWFRQNDVSYLLLGCNYFGNIWHLIRNQIDISLVDILFLSDHFIQFDHMGGATKPIRMPPTKHHMFFQEVKYDMLIMRSETIDTRNMFDVLK